MEFYERIENQSGKFIKVLRTDQGREYEGERLATWKKQKGIIHKTNRYTYPTTEWSFRKVKPNSNGRCSQLYVQQQQQHQTAL
jgi:hypothetical protein